MRLQIVDPGRSSVKRAARAAIVMPAVVASADNVINNQRTTFLAAFGSFAILVLADFALRGERASAPTRASRLPALS